MQVPVSATSNGAEKPPTAQVPAVYVVPDDEDEIPDPFPFPKTYEVNIEAELAIGKVGKCWINQFILDFCVGKLSSWSQTKFVTTIAGVMALYRRKPRAADYERVAREIVQKYPFIRDPISGHVCNTISTG